MGYRDRVSAWKSAAPVLALVLLGCSSDSSTRPASTRFNLSGQVRLVSALFNLSGFPQGTLAVDDADSLAVYLEGSDGIVDSTRTLDGKYSFSGVVPGVYHVSSWVLRAHPVRLADVTVSDADVEDPDILVLWPMGHMQTSPNPSEPEGFGLEFTADGPQRYSVEIFDLQLDLVWSFADTTVGGFNHVHWDGDGPDEMAAPAGAYWAVVHVNGGDAYNLAFWQPADEPVSAGNCGHILANGLFLRQDDSILVTEWNGAQRGTLQVAAGGVEAGLELLFLRADSTAYAIADTCPDNRLTWTIADTNLVSAELVPGRKWTFDLAGKRAGSTTITLHGWHQQHIHLSSLPIPVEITEGSRRRDPGPTE
jgi:hypothetical protein